ncbi:DUF4829 domain-containing protein [Pseudobacteroides cellulosolvens]|uniref:DUF4829 domain-containing protein n=1 Tax=Pseudobacteroides cellulosolvens TaxID=35825 RepID=UPI0023EA6638|nr:DUF4829 domain-containing protein [Pseudobacteroides cellulosolvens]
MYTQEVRIPTTFSDKPGDIPIGLYWAYNNELSKDIGLDISPYKDKEAIAFTAYLKENIDNYPNRLRAEIIACDGKIIGAWLGRGAHYGFAAALNKRHFAEIVNKTWDEWLVCEGLVDYNNGFDAETKSLSPKEVIKKYFEAMDTRDYKTAYALLSKAEQTFYLFRNLDSHKLYQSSWDADVLGIPNIIQAKLKECRLRDNYRYDPNNRPPKDLLNRNVSKKVHYIIVADMKYKQIVTCANGINSWTMTLVKENPDAPWRIDAENTG